ncbi:unnamed protein product, partial [Ectocarpus sp. 8 AP-2014]
NTVLPVASAHFWYKAQDAVWWLGKTSGHTPTMPPLVNHSTPRQSTQLASKGPANHAEPKRQQIQTCVHQLSTKACVELRVCRIRRKARRSSSGIVVVTLGQETRRPRKRTWHRWRLCF